MSYYQFMQSELDASKAVRDFNRLLKDYWFHYSRKQHILSNKFFKKTETPEIDVTLDIIKWKLHAIDTFKASVEINKIHQV